MKRRDGFTLVEMICVLAIVAVLLAVITDGVNMSLRSASFGFHEAVISEQMEQALDMIEQDVRIAKDVDVDYWASRGNLMDMRAHHALRLLTVDEADEAKEGRVVYTTKLANTTYMEERPAERPTPGMVLYRAVDDSVHSGADQPVGMHLNDNMGEPAGFTVRYYNNVGEPCSLAEDVHSIEVILSGTTEQGALVTQSRVIPFSAKFK